MENNDLLLIGNQGLHWEIFTSLKKDKEETIKNIINENPKMENFFTIRVNWRFSEIIDVVIDKMYIINSNGDLEEQEVNKELKDFIYNNVTFY